MHERVRERSNWFWDVCLFIFISWSIYVRFLFYPIQNRITVEFIHWSPSHQLLDVQKNESAYAAIIVNLFGAIRDDCFVAARDICSMSDDMIINRKSHRPDTRIAIRNSSSSIENFKWIESSRGWITMAETQWLELFPGNHLIDNQWALFSFLVLSIITWADQSRCG